MPDRPQLLPNGLQHPYPAVLNEYVPRCEYRLHKNQILDPAIHPEATSHHGIGYREHGRSAQKKVR